MLAPFYEDEAVRLYHGDCLGVLPYLYPVDHVITDPPYGRDVYVRMSMPRTKAGSGSPVRLGVESKGANWTKRQGGAIRQMAVGEIGAVDELIDPLASSLGRWRVNRWLIVFSDIESTHKWKDALERYGFRYVRTGIWVKPDAMPQMTGDRPGTGCEPCTICHATGPMRWNGGGSLAIWTHYTAKGDGRPEGHPCPKPLPLMTELVTLFTDEGETILDPFAGSGTTLVAAKLNGRKAIGIEISEQYCEVAAKRLRQTEPGRLFDEIKAKPQKLFTKSLVSGGEDMVE